MTDYKYTGNQRKWQWRTEVAKRKGETASINYRELRAGHSLWGCLINSRATPALWDTSILTLQVSSCPMKLLEWFLRQEGNEFVGVFINQLFRIALVQSASSRCVVNSSDCMSCFPFLICCYHTFMQRILFKCLVLKPCKQCLHDLVLAVHSRSSSLFRVRADVLLGHFCEIIITASESSRPCACVGSSFKAGASPVSWQ